MAKNNNARVCSLSHLPKKPCITAILAILTRISQWWRYRKLVRAVSQGKLTESLEILAESGIEGDFEGDIAGFVIGTIQSLGAVR
ncbi:hypothetical protein H6G33_36460 [Calothrix sp. FACHB-1219]|uniref:hypothetical protein n=1 Tax=unclassified Calothrix TaxID=2619626 RepID=UPI001687F723|nr:MULTISPECIES: hypothetical protein [unclassified Calothrix]MBD2207838.1 hypothetical protein [Calothrix sp. FACHB-168]MBD2222426.1 hypothetical protein [Calothrix sp. FACHB-1219]